MKCRNSRLASLYECVYWNVNGYNVNLSGFCKYSEFVVRQCSVYLEDFALNNLDCTMGNQGSSAHEPFDRAQAVANVAVDLKMVQ